jgi:hypothetical protein
MQLAIVPSVYYQVLPAQHSSDDIVILRFICFWVVISKINESWEGALVPTDGKLIRKEALVL